MNGPESTEETNSVAGLAVEQVEQSTTTPDDNVPDPQTANLLNQLEIGTNVEVRLANLQAVIAKKRNPYLEAGKHLLRFLAEIPSLDNLSVNQLDRLKVLLTTEIETFTQLCERCKLRREHILAVRYTLCTAIDEAIGQTVWGGGSKDVKLTGPWSTRSLAQYFHEDVQGGSSVFLLLGRLSSSPIEHNDVLEVMLHVLGLDFQGEYRNKTSGQRTLALIRHQLHTLISSNREVVLRELSPNYFIAKGKNFRHIRNIPIWVSASVFGLIIFSMFSWYKYQLLTKSDEVIENINLISKLAPQQQSAQVDLKALLEAEIKAGLLTVNTVGTKSVIIFKSDDMFVKRATLSKKSLEMLPRIAAELIKVKGQIDIIGYTDNKPIATKEFPDNLALSKKRAIVVAQVLIKSGIEDIRLHILGMGETSPIADNSTEEGRAKNRRVEIIVTEGEIPAKPNQQGSSDMNEILQAIEQKKPIIGSESRAEPAAASSAIKQQANNNNSVGNLKGDK